jgi:alkylated DNA repair dioxygenase AlkB
MSRNTLSPMPVDYITGAFMDPAGYLKDLQTLSWSDRGAPRSEYYISRLNKPYTYGKGRGEREYQPQPATPFIDVLWWIAERYANCKFDVCFLNRYADQHQHLGWHADDSPEMDDYRPIVIVSFGAAREIWFRKTPPSDVRGTTNDVVMVDDGQPSIHKLLLENGSIAIMAAGMQDTWQHRIPKHSAPCGERISLTFRGYAG